MTRSNCGCGHQGCVECEIPQLARNNYFTGKLLVERDFTDEQRYLIGKERRHNQRLHGCGTACGLKVIEHPDPGCRDRFVLVGAGTAIDCCGREILLERPEYFDFRSAFEQAWRAANPGVADIDRLPHLLQVCLRYAECPAEDVPALLDDCGCDDNACHPSRIVETHQLQVILDPPSTGSDPEGPRFDWESTITVAGASRVAVDDVNDLVYVLTQDSPARLYVVNAGNQNVMAAADFADQRGLDVAVSGDGRHVYVAVQDEVQTANSPEVWVLEPGAAVSQPVVRKASIPKGRDGTIRLAVVPEPDGRLFVLNGKSGQVLVFGTAINNPGTGSPRPTMINLGLTPTAIAISASAAFAYVAEFDASVAAGGNVAVIDVNKLTSTPAATIPLVAALFPDGLTVSRVPDGDNLAVTDSTNGKLELVGWRPNAVPDPARAVAFPPPVGGFAFPPIGVAFSPGGAWTYVLERNEADGKSYMQSVSAHRMQLGAPTQAGFAYRVGDGSQQLVLNADGRAMYASFLGGGGAAEGGVAVLEAGEENCEGLFERALDACGPCECGDCLVLATVRGYIDGDDVAEARIDNLADRRLLPSTDLLAEVVECMLENPPGGQRGPIGPVGPAGPQGQTGPPGPPGRGLPPDLVNICGISWTDQEVYQRGIVPELVIGFSDFVRSKDLLVMDATGHYPQNVKISASRINPAAGGRIFIELPATVATMNENRCDPRSFIADKIQNDWATAVKVTPEKPLPPSTEVLVYLDGDRILCKRNELALDADNLVSNGGCQPTQAQPTGDGVPGGTFRSWFSTGRAPRPSTGLRPNISPRRRR